MYVANVHACRKFNDLSEKQPALRPNWLEKKSVVAVDLLPICQAKFTSRHQNQNHDKLFIQILSLLLRFLQKLTRVMVEQFLISIMMDAKHNKIIRNNQDIFFMFTSKSFCLKQLKTLGYKRKKNLDCSRRIFSRLAFKIIDIRK